MLQSEKRHSGLHEPESDKYLLCQTGQRGNGSVEQVRKEIQQIRDLWMDCGSSQKLVNLYKINF